MKINYISIKINIIFAAVANVLPNEVEIITEENDELLAKNNNSEKATFDQIIEANESMYFMTSYLCYSFKVHMALKGVIYYSLNDAE